MPSAIPLPGSIEKRSQPDLPAVPRHGNWSRGNTPLRQDSELRHFEMLFSSFNGLGCFARNAFTAPAENQLQTPEWILHRRLRPQMQVRKKKGLWALARSPFSCFGGRGEVQLSWEEKAKRAEKHSDKLEEGEKIMVDLSTQKPEIDGWIAKNKRKLETLLRPIVISLFNAEKVIKE
mgnify:CR=1 FL=1